MMNMRTAREEATGRKVKTLKEARIRSSRSSAPSGPLPPSKLPTVNRWRFFGRSRSSSGLSWGCGRATSI